MRVEIDPAAIQDMLDLWSRATDMPQLSSTANIRLLDNRRALLTHHKRNASTWALILHAMAPVDDEPEFAALKARVDAFRQRASDELVKYCSLE